MTSGMTEAAKGNFFRAHRIFSLNLDGLSQCKGLTRNPDEFLTELVSCAPSGRSQTMSDKQIRICAHIRYAYVHILIHSYIVSTLTLTIYHYHLRYYLSAIRIIHPLLHSKVLVCR